MINEATLANLRRKSEYVDRVQLYGRDQVPLPSWIDLNLTELCNRNCVFCPRSDPEHYPNQKLHMALPLVEKIAKELASIDYAGVIVLCGFGEPTLHPALIEVVSTLRTHAGTRKPRIEIVTDGDFLTPDKIRKLHEAGLDYFVVSLYDGEHQVAPMHERFKEAGLGPWQGENESRFYMLRDRWHSDADGYGLKLTNRAGMVSVGQQEPVDRTKPCHYLAYQLTVDWNGDVLLCVQDWNKRLKYGNLNSQSVLEVWRSPAMHKRRMLLMDGKRNSMPCSNCNTDGTLHGFNHVPAWRRSGR